MEASARQKFVIMSPRKIRRVINVIRGKRVMEAYNILKLMPYSAADVVLKKLIEAAYNAKVKFGAEPESLIVSEAFADDGPIYRRFKPRAQGRIYRREKRVAHFTLKVRLLEKHIPEKKVEAK